MGVPKTYPLMLRAVVIYITKINKKINRKGCPKEVWNDIILNFLLCTSWLMTCGSYWECYESQRLQRKTK